MARTIEQGARRRRGVLRLVADLLLVLAVGIEDTKRSALPRPGFFGRVREVFKLTFKRVDFGAIMRRSAAVAYYGALSLAPLLVIALGIASLAWDRESVRSGIVTEMRNLTGPSGALLIEGVLDKTQGGDKGLLATIAGFVMLLFGATAVFIELQDGLNWIWGVEAKKGRGIWKFVRTRLLSAAMVFSLGFLLLVSLVVSAALSALTKSFRLGDLAIVGMAVHFLVALLGTSVLFAALFKFLPDVRPRWREVRFGAVMTALLFNLGQIGIGEYLGRTGVGSAYGAAGSLVIVLVWLYYSSALVFFGAQLTEADARCRRGTC